MLDIRRRGISRIHHIQALSHMVRIIALEDIDWYTDCLSISYFLRFSAVIAFDGQKKVSLFKVGNYFYFSSFFFSDLFQSRTISAEEVKTQ